MGRNWHHLQTVVDSGVLDADTKILIEKWRHIRVELGIDHDDKECEKLSNKPLFCTYRGERFRCTDIAVSGFVSLSRKLDIVAREAEIDVLAMSELCTDWSVR